MNLETLDNRLKQLALFDQATRYAKQKDSLQRELENFLASLPSSPTVMTATPRDLCRFLVAAVGSFIVGNDREILVPWTHRSHQETANEKSCYMMHSSQSAAVL